MSDGVSGGVSYVVSGGVSVSDGVFGVVSGGVWHNLTI